LVDSGEVLGLGSLDLIGVFWDAVGDDWVVVGSWGVVVCWGMFVVI